MFITVYNTNFEKNCVRMIMKLTFTNKKKFVSTIANATVCVIYQKRIIEF